MEDGHRVLSKALSSNFNVFKLVSDALLEQAITSQIKKETYEEFKDRVMGKLDVRIKATRLYLPFFVLTPSTELTDGVKG